VDEPRALAETCRSRGVHPGISINPETAVDTILDVLDAVDQVLIMTVHPGFGGQEFIVENLEKIRRIRRLRPTGLHIAVDGGINDKTADGVCRAGADVLIAGTFLFRSADMKEAIAGLRRACAV
jgi:ribulose-phosphate 3-epimerase